MIVGIVLGAIGTLIAIFALKCLRMGNMEDSVKATMTLASGVMFILGGKGFYGSIFYLCTFHSESFSLN